MTATPQNDHNGLGISNFSSKIIFLEIVLIQNTKKKFGNRKNDDYLVVETNTKSRQNSFNDIIFDKIQDKTASASARTESKELLGMRRYPE